MLKNYRHSHFDANETIFFQQELQVVLAGTYDIKYPQLKARELFPVNMSAGPGAETIVYDQYDQVGMAKIIANYADDAPRADVKGKQFTAIIKSLGASYGYSLQEVRAAQMARKPLVQGKADAAKRAIMQKENSIAFKGDTSYGLPGFLTNPNVIAVTIPVGASTTTPWSTKTGDEILADMNAMASASMVATNAVEMPDTMLMPYAQLNLIKNKRVGVSTDGPSQSVYAAFLQNNDVIKEITWVNELKGSAPGGLDYIVCYRRDPNALELHIPQDFEQLPPQERNFESVINCHERIGGVLIYYPLSVAIGYGI